MNTLADAVTRPGSRHPVPKPDASLWLAAIATALAFAIVATLIVPAALILPTVAVALFLASIVPMTITRHGKSADTPARRDNARLFAGMVFALGILASVFTDLDRVADYLR